MTTTTEDNSSNHNLELIESLLLDGSTDTMVADDNAGTAITSNVLESLQTQEDLEKVLIESSINDTILLQNVSFDPNFFDRVNLELGITQSTDHNTNDSMDVVSHNTVNDDIDLPNNDNVGPLPQTNCSFVDDHCLDSLELQLLKESPSNVLHHLDHHSSPTTRDPTAFLTSSSSDPLVSSTTANYPAFDCDLTSTSTTTTPTNEHCDFLINDHDNNDDSVNDVTMIDDNPTVDDVVGDIKFFNDAATELKSEQSNQITLMQSSTVLSPSTSTLSSSATTIQNNTIVTDVNVKLTTPNVATTTMPIHQHHLQQAQHHQMKTSLSCSSTASTVTLSPSSASTVLTSTSLSANSTIARLSNNTAATIHHQLHPTSLQSHTHPPPTATFVNEKVFLTTTGPISALSLAQMKVVGSNVLAIFSDQQASLTPTTTAHLPQIHQPDLDQLGGKITLSTEHQSAVAGSGTRLIIIEEKPSLPLINHELNQPQPTNKLTKNTGNKNCTKSNLMSSKGTDLKG